jgi:hypothetical protein
VSIALATVLSERGLQSRMDQFAHDRLQSAAAHTADLAAGFYGQDGRWTSATATQLTHLVEMNGYRIALTDRRGRPVGASAQVPPPRAEADVVIDRRRVGTITVAPRTGEVLTGDDRALRDRLNSRHWTCAKSSNERADVYRE